MSLLVSTAIQVTGPDGVQLVSVTEGDTSINLNPQDAGAEILLAKARVEAICEQAKTRALERLDELQGVIERWVEP
ncbi:MAG TPA: hypothetical protein VK756_07655 [Solirubrobacteraceae bacterium]|jgi:hypothetical protein|nr:hypothetical protein [Solirubrobacteraceae bacterium]